MSNKAWEELKSLKNAIYGVFIALILLIVFMIFKPWLTVDKKGKVALVKEQTVSQPSTETKASAGFPDFRNPLELLADREDAYALAVKKGYKIITETATEIGPLAPEGKQFAGNKLACQNCHLNAGQKAFSAPYVGVSTLFPQYRGREDQIGTLGERVNGCMERSMNGKALDLQSVEMKNILSYMTWLSEDQVAGKKVEGRGFVKLEIPNRAVDLEKGAHIYASFCAVCHGAEGQGKMRADGLAYEYPPVWGEDSYNHGAGMNRVLTAAAFIKGNMPFGATHENPILSDEEAYDVAGYIDAQDRPLKANTEKDYPDLKRKPVSTPYGPWPDDFSAEQHKFGPFQEIIAFHEKKFNLHKTK